MKRERKKHPKNISLSLEFQRFNRIGKITSQWIDGLYLSKKPYLEHRIRIYEE